MIVREILRIIVALVFIVSGFVKAVDPVGFSFKLEEYFGAGVFNLPLLEKNALLIGIVVVVIELFLGLSLLIKYKVKAVLVALIILCVFFGFLTFYSAYFNVVTDCGCFGDALKLTPWQSFWKDIVLLVLLVILHLLNRKANEKAREKKLWKVIILGFCGAIMGSIIMKGIKEEPIIDFRDYKVGTDLRLEKKKIADDPSVYQTIYKLKDKVTGQEKKVNQDQFVANKEYWSKDSNWEIQSDKTTQELKYQGYQSEISKFKIENGEGEDITQEILDAEHVVLVFAYKPHDVPAELKQSIENKVKANPLVYGVSTSLDTFSVIENTKMDGIAIKTIARSNPFVLVLQKGKIIEKVPGKNY